MLKEYTHQRCLKNETLPLGFWKDCRSLVHGEWRESSAWIHRSTESLSTMVKAVVSISIMFAWKNLWGSSVPYIAHTELYTELNGFTRLLESWNQSAILLCIVKNNGWNVHRHSHTWVVTVSTTHTHTHTHTHSLQLPQCQPMPQWDSRTCRTVEVKWSSGGEPSCDEGPQIP